MSLHQTVGDLTNPQAQQSGIVPSDAHLELGPLCYLLSHFVVNAMEKLEDNKVVFLLCACVCYIPEKNGPVSVALKESDLFLKN